MYFVGCSFTEIFPMCFFPSMKCGYRFQEEDHIGEELLSSHPIESILSTLLITVDVDLGYLAVVVFVLFSPVKLLFLLPFPHFALWKEAKLCSLPLRSGELSKYFLVGGVSTCIIWNYFTFEICIPPLLIQSFIYVYMELWIFILHFG